MKLIKSAKKFIDQKSNKNQFLTGALVLAVAGIICRVIGVVFRIPLTNIVGNFGMGLYQMVFPLYSLLLIVSSAGVPVAISKMVAREKVNGDMKQCKKILSSALLLLGIIGLVLSALFMIFSGSIASLQGNKDVGIIYIAIAPSVFLVCLISAFRGYFQGLQNMMPTAVSQIIEQLVKVTVGVVLALIFIKRSVVMAVFGAILAVTASEAVALAFLIIVYLGKKGTKIKSENKDNPAEAGQSEIRNISATEQINTSVAKDKNVKENNHTAASNPIVKMFRSAFDKKLMGEILKQSLPITLMASIFPLILVFDSLVIINLLKTAGNTSEMATKLFGIQSGAVHTLINLPAVIGVALATAVVPTISSLIKQNKSDEVRTKSALAVKLIFIISVFFLVFYLFFADKIIDLLYHNAFKDNPGHFKIATDLLKIESAMILLMGISQVFTAMLQAGDKAKFPLIALAVGGTAKIVFELIFIKTKMGIYAVSISNVICFALAAAINTVFALKNFKIKTRLLQVVLKFVMLSVGYFGFLFILNLIFPNGRWWLTLIGALAFGFYGALLFCLKLFDKKEKKVFSKLGAE